MDTTTQSLKLKEKLKPYLKTIWRTSEFLSVAPCFEGSNIPKHTHTTAATATPEAASAAAKVT